MGLDIYLRKCPDLPAALAAEAAYEQASNKVWAEYPAYEKMTEAQKDEARKACEQLAPKFGCTGRWNGHASIERIDERNSSIDPDHLFKIGYFRSSYNEGGIERLMQRLGLPDLHTIFDTDGNDHDLRPDWYAALSRCDAAIAGYTTYLQRPEARFDVTELRPMWEFGSESAGDALKMFAEQLAANEARSADFCNFSNRDGHFFMGGMKVHAVITKKYARPDPGDLIGRLINTPAVFVVFEKEHEDGKEDWYLTALRIVRETIEFVLAQPDKQHYYLVWSG